jgi:8-oxo-dGTP pyrophosphatase MutT (NUDIX family)
MLPVSVKGVLMTGQNKIVLVLNDRGEWELPGGRIELGESAQDCLAREIKEELGVTAKVGEPIDSYLFEVIPGRHVFIVTYLSSVEGAFLPRLSHEHGQVGTFSPEDLPANIPPGYWQSIQAALLRSGQAAKRTLAEAEVANPRSH